MISTLSDLLGNSHKTISNWKKEKRPIINLLYKYFTKEELEEFLEKGSIKRLEKQYIYDDFFSKYKENYFEYFRKNTGPINNFDYHLIEYYFKYLFFIKKNKEKFNMYKKPFNAAAIEFSLEFEFEYKEKLQESTQKKYKNGLNKRQIDDFHLIIDLLNFMDEEKGMWDYFHYILSNNFSDWIEDIDVSKYIKDDKIIYTIEDNPFNIDGLDHYYLFNCYNNIEPYSISEIIEY